MKYFFTIFSLVGLIFLLSFGLSCLNGYFYPMKFVDEINFFAKEYKISPALIASIANVESGFKESAKSSKGAVGIMQLLPSTAEWVAGKIGEEFSEELLYDGSYNLKLGSYYISYLINIFGDEKVAICAYNAGQGNVKNWLQNSKYSSDGKALEHIPFKETENYLSRVIKNQHYYKNKYN